MGFSLKGYIVEGPRVGGSNSSFSMTPNVYVSNSGAFSTAYPANESAPRTDYIVMVLAEGDLSDVVFGWSKNEGLEPNEPGVQRFDYNTDRNTFYPLAGAMPLVLGLLDSDANTIRMKVPVPVGVMSSAPFRLSVGIAGSGTTLATSLVTSFGSPAVGTVEILTTGSDAGQLNWNPADLTTYANQTVWFQRQNFFSTKESNGKLGLIQNDTLILNPLPGPGQFPLIRIGFGLWLTTDEVANEDSFSVNPTAGHVEWARSTGMLKFNSGDISANSERYVYYDGVLLGKSLTLTVQSLGTVNAGGTQSTTLTTVPPAGGDLIFRVPGVTAFDESVLVTTFDTIGKRGQVQYNAAGQVRLSKIDRTIYGGQALEVVYGDLLIERGLSLRWFRTPVDLAGTNDELKDLTCIYPVTAATVADPMVASPQIFLPALPIDSPSYPMTFNVVQGTGTYTGSLSRLDVANPPSGMGFVIDFDQKVLIYAFRNNDILVKVPAPGSSFLQLDPLILDYQTKFALETSLGSGAYTDLARDVDFLLDTITGQLSFTSTFGVKRRAGTKGAFSSTTFTDLTADFIAAGVAVGDYLVVKSGSSKGVYVVQSRTTTQITTDFAGTTGNHLVYEIRSGKEILADRYFQDIPIVDPKVKVEKIRSLGTISNSPRLTVAKTSGVRFRFGFSRFSTSVTVVSNDGSFSSPASLTAGVVEVSAATGNVNFSSADVAEGGTVYGVYPLVQGAEYRVNPQLGFISFTERMLTGDEGLITYANAEDPQTVISEPITFLVRKEAVQPRNSDATTLHFNPTGRRVASTPEPKAYRGGRPQTSKQVNFDVSASTVTFLPDDQLTDALPHGANVAANERVLIDYYVYAAFGGENSTSALKPPINLARVIIKEGTNTLLLPGDYTPNFIPGCLLQVNTDQVYMLGSASYDAQTASTTITLAGTQTFIDDVPDPKLSVSSGLTRTSSSGGFPSYFTTELGSYDSVPRGMNVFRLVGDKTSAYKTHTIVLFTDGTYTHFYRVTGSKYDENTNRTEVSLATNSLKQYVGVTMKYSVRPVHPAAPDQATTSANPVFFFPGDGNTQQYVLFRRVEGFKGQLLETPDDYKVDDAGVIHLHVPLQLNEELSICYTGRRVVASGLRLKTSYTYTIAPTTDNGLLNQVLQANYFIWGPDTAYFRVETITSFRAEVATELEKDAKSSAPTAGPQTSNSSSPKLVDQGRESVYFKENHYANQDIMARTILKYYNDAINYLEDALYAADGRLVGDKDGRFKFDGLLNTTVRTSYAALTNHIDDLIQISPFPAPSGTAVPMYMPSPYSRVYPTRRNLIVGPTVAVTEDLKPIFKVDYSFYSFPNSMKTRTPRARILNTYPIGTSVFTVDSTAAAGKRPAFVANMKVIIKDAAGTTYVTDAQGLYVTSFTGTTITLSGPTTAIVPAGATIYASPSDMSTLLTDGATNGYTMVYQKGKDYDVNMDTGEVLWRQKLPPLDGSIPIVPKFLWTNEIPADALLMAYDVGVNNTSVEPDKFPALFGGTADDDGDEAVPLTGGVPVPEFTTGSVTTLNAEKAIIATSPAGTLRSAVTPSFVGTGSLNAARTIITNTSNFTAPLPKVYDLVRILTGLNGATSFRRITAVGTNTITVDSAFTTQDSGFTYTIAVSSLTVSGTASFSGTSVTDASATYTTSVKVGQTVVVTNGTDAGLRRQIVSINSNTNLTVNASFPTATTQTYRVDNPLATFGGTGSVQSTLSTTLASEAASLSTGSSSMLGSVLAFFDNVFTTLVSTSNGVVALGNLTRLTDSSADYLAADISQAHYVYITTGSNVGLYKIASVDSATQITVAAPFTVAMTGMSYKIVSVFGISYEGLSELFTTVSGNVRYNSSTLSFQSLVDTSVGVLRSGVADSGAFARGVLTTDVDGRELIVQERIDAVSDPDSGMVSKIEGFLTSTEKLYDKRYVWIDARTNVEKGLLYLKLRAADNRNKTIADTTKQLIKLLTVKS